MVSKDLAGGEVAGGEDDLEVLRAAALLDPDEHEQWDVVHAFQKRADRSAFEAARVLVRAADARERVIGLTILAQFGSRADRLFLEERLSIAIEACADPQAEVIRSAVLALAHLGDPRGLAAALGQEGHPDEDVRQAVAFALPSVGGDPACPDAVAALIRLSGDRSDYVRDWATFGLGLESAGDGERIRRALLERVGDPDRDTAAEAFLGLAQRGDRRMLSALGVALEGPDPADKVIEAAAELAAPELLPALHRLKQRAGADADLRASTIDEAISACSAAAAAHAGGGPEPEAP
ncbi:HEAT repeat domain-containing protein [Kitasatospora sp. NBC_01250]|uniref:HEAT repeat domain-containing protein n=1 Tax=Kitasatospora sp. NBC_01250 TaxID=2903571 RepID=UPI002E3012A6|nr:HEAT repeat domain-containing protein [Kitasatospora sp. NBC_01250]